MIRSFSSQAPEQTLSEVATRTGLTRAGARRILLTLETLGYVQADGRKFRLQPSILDLGWSYVDSHPAWHAVQPFMRQLALDHDVGAGLTVLDGESIIFLARSITASDPRVCFAFGGRYPAAYTASGLAMLAALDPFQLDLRLSTIRLEAHTPHSVTTLHALRQRIAETERDGYAFTDQELALGVMALAKVVRGPGGRVVCALSLPVDTDRFTAAEFRARFAPLLIDTVARVEAELARRPGA